MKRVMVAAVWVGLGLGACADDFSDVSLGNTGKACLLPVGSDAPGEIGAGEAAVVRVVIAPCESGCATVEETSCTAVLEGGVVLVESSATLRFRESETCPGSCTVVVAECEAPVLAAGTYSVVHGGETRVVTVPGTDSCE